MTADLLAASESVGATTTKSPAAFRTITEVANELDLPQHVLRFWESKFSQIRPMKRRGGRRYYRPEDVVLLREIRRLLYVEGYTIRGVQKLLREQNRKALLARRPVAEAVEAGGAPAASGGGDVTGQAVEPGASPVRERPLSTAQRKSLLALLAELEELRALLPQARPPRPD